ncbi:Leukocyte surface antigen cd53 [Entophlyctis luteolus]|nr:Leukocyte surface antigen cd53 [Entophlyctis luteolus]
MTENLSRDRAIQSLRCRALDLISNSCSNIVADSPPVLLKALVVTLRPDDRFAEGLFDNERLLCSAVQHLHVPPIFARDFDSLDETSRTQMARFSLEAASILDILASLFSRSDPLCSVNDLREETVVEILSRCAAFGAVSTTADREFDSRWITPECRSASTSLVQALEGTRLQKAPPLLVQHALSILATKVQPLFDSHRREEKRLVPGKPPKNPLDRVDNFDPPWKADDAIECVSIFECVVYSLEPYENVAANVRHLVVPTVLKLIDDYEPRNKCRGIRIFRDCILISHDVYLGGPGGITKNGLAEVFFETLRGSMSHHSMPEVLKETFPAITALGALLDTAAGKDAVPKKSMIVMEDGVIRGLRIAIGGKLEVVRILLNAISPVVDLLDLFTVRYLEPLISLTTETLEIHIYDFATQQVAASALLHILCRCWPRIAADSGRKDAAGKGTYCGQVLATASEVWMELARADSVENREKRLSKDNGALKDRDLIRDLLKKIVAALWETCGETMKLVWEWIPRVMRAARMPFLSRISTFTFNKDTFFSSGGFTFIKNLLMFINFLSLLAGVILIGGGAYIQANAGQDDLIDLSGSTAAAAIAIGVFVTTISLFGIFGAANEKGMLLKTYFGLLILLVVFELGVGIAAYVKSDAVEDLLQTAWITSVTSGTQQQLNNIQHVERAFSCCGFRNVSEYAVPSNCATPQSFNFTVPCLASVKGALQGSLSTIGGTGVALGVVELVGLVMSVVLFVKIAQKDRASESLMNEAWRINRSKIQYGYANYQYV